MHVWSRGKVLGGSSTINAMGHIRGHRASYDGWAALGATGWGYEDLLPYFKRSESAPGRDPALRGTQGPLRVAPIQSESCGSPYGSAASAWWLNVGPLTTSATVTRRRQFHPAGLDPPCQFNVYDPGIVRKPLTHHWLHPVHFIQIRRGQKMRRCDTLRTTPCLVF